MARIETIPIVDEDADEVAHFLHIELNPRVTAAAWKALLQPPWAQSGPHHGFLLRVDDEIAGVYAAVFSRRERADGTNVPVCNLAAFCVREEHRMHSVRLIRALLAQREWVFTDLSPSGNVVAMNERLGFRHLDTATRVVLNVPHPRRGVRVTGDPAALSSVLRGRDADVYRDHATTAAARHVLVQRGDAYAYLVFRAVSRKRVRAFAAPLYVGGDSALLEAGWGQVRSHILLHHRLPFTLAEHRILGFRKGLGREQAHPRPKMVRGDRLPDASIDYLYSELALVDW